ncbi:MAG: TraR/DksA C4-type zinc finger protein [Acidobacteriaceae bacterium]|nr:TraR/DksA C4-type zinc finger protein [Acidobacteriaceae bacterium]
MDAEHFRKLLVEKEQELLDEIPRLAGQAREARGAEVEDRADEATDSEAKFTAFEETSLANETLVQVRAALQRLDRGEYGRCVQCGRQIGLARLEAVPWTPYCLEDQQKHKGVG